MTRPRIYCAHPMTAYGTICERRSLAAIRRLLPGVHLVDPNGMFTSTGDWLERWPDVLGTLDALILFADERGAIGAGCVQEVTGAHRAGVPVALFDHGTRRLHRLAALAFPDLPTLRVAGRPVAGEVLTWELVGRPPRICEVP